MSTDSDTRKALGACRSCGSELACIPGCQEYDARCNHVLDKASAPARERGEFGSTVSGNLVAHISEILCEVGALREEITMLEIDLGEFGKRLVPVLAINSENKPKDEQIIKRAPTHSPLGGLIRAEKVRVSELRLEITDLIKRIRI